MDLLNMIIKYIKKTFVEYRMMGATSGAGTASPSGTHEFMRILVGFGLFCVLLCGPLFVFLVFSVWTIVLPVSGLPVSEYSLHICKVVVPYFLPIQYTFTHLYN